MATAPRNRPHFLVQGGGESEIYTSPRRGSSGLPPTRARAAHAAKLEQALGLAIAGARKQLQARDPHLAQGEAGFYLDFEVPVEHQEALDSLENRPKKIELVAVRSPSEDAERCALRCSCPEAQRNISRTRSSIPDEETAGGKPKNQTLSRGSRCAALRAAALALPDADDLFPADGVQCGGEVCFATGGCPTSVLSPRVSRSR